MELITKMFYVLTSLIFNHGYTGLGSRMDDICGRDWVAGAGDHGDPGLILFMTMFQPPSSYPFLKQLLHMTTSADLEQAISDLQSKTGVSIPLVVFGHMHKRLAYGGGLRKMIAFGANQTIYLNGAVVPRVKHAGESSAAVISTSGSDGLQGSGSMAHTSRAFTTVDLFDGVVEKICEVWVLVSGAGAELEEETVLYKRPREQM
jgi:hypothetical protein